MLRTSRDVDSASNAAMPIKNPERITRQAVVRETNRVGLFIGDHSFRDAKPQRPNCSSKWTPASNRRTTIASTQAKMQEISNATMSATTPGNRCASSVRNFVVDWFNACLTWSHTSYLPSKSLRIKPVRPPPAGYEIRFGRFVRERQMLDPLLDARRSGSLQFPFVGDDPCQIQGRHRPEQVIAIDRLEAVGQGEVIHDSRPQFVRHINQVRCRAGQFPQFK